MRRTRLSYCEWKLSAPSLWMLESSRHCPQLSVHVCCAALKAPVLVISYSMTHAMSVAPEVLPRSKRTTQRGGGGAKGGGGGLGLGGGGLGLGGGGEGGGLSQVPISSVSPANSMLRPEFPQQPTEYSSSISETPA